MNLIIGGGVHEHGRNCFYIRSDVNYIVDCGIMRGADYPFPHLANSDISAAEYLFLTHSHEDHTGAFRWLVRNGFKGTVVASAETLSALPHYADTVALSLDGRRKDFGKICISYGRSGHCAGSLWFDIKTRSSKVFFSGDYCENSCYSVDKIRERRADAAILDCAFGVTDYNRGIQEEKILAFAESSLKTGSILFPVPKNGRAADLILLLSKLECNFITDSTISGFFFEQEEKGWIPRALCEKVINALCRPYNDNLNNVLFIADAQLSSEMGVTVSDYVLKQGGRVLLTGYVDANSEAERLFKSGLAQCVPYNAHCCKKDVDYIASKNYFKEIICYHCE